MIFLGCEAVYSFTKLHGVTYQRAVTFITLFVSSQTALSNVPQFCVQKFFVLDTRLRKFIGMQASVLPGWVCTCLHSGRYDTSERLIEQKYSVSAGSERARHVDVCLQLMASRKQQHARSPAKSLRLHVIITRDSVVSAILVQGTSGVSKFRDEA